MDISNRLSMSYYKTIDTLNEDHKIYLVKHIETGKLYVKKILDIYNKDIYTYLHKQPIKGIPTIVSMYEDDNHLIVIEHFVSGLTLSDTMKNHALTLDNIVQIMLELCDILEPLHTQQPPIVHRDIKPSNIIITEYGHAMLLDFNAAKYYKSPDSNDTILLGTKGYAAPEQYGFGSSSPKTDIYALGVLLKEMLSSVNSTLPKDFDMIITKCTQINPEDRYDSITSLKESILCMITPKESIDIIVKSNYNNISGIRRFLPPGYRTLTPWRMLYATFGYAFLIWMTCTLDFKTSSSGQPVSSTVAIIEKVFVFIMSIAIILFNGNYLDMQKHFPVCRNKNPLIRHIGIALIDASILLLLFTIMAILILILT